MNSTYEKFSRQSGLVQTALTRAVRRSACISLASFLCAAAPWATAAPLPNGTKLTITQSPPIPPGVYPANTIPFTTGSAFGMGIISGFYTWTPIPPGTDGGIVIGKAQLSGGQEVVKESTNDGQLTGMWDYGGNHGTFFTAPSDAGNVFDDQNCTGSACGSNTVPRKTDLAIWNTAWAENIVPMGSAAGCTNGVPNAFGNTMSNCTADMVAGVFVTSWTIDPVGSNPRNYELIYSQIVPKVFANFPYKLVLRGTVELCSPCASLTADKINITKGTTVTLTGACTTTNPITITSCLLTSVPATVTVNTKLPNTGSDTAFNWTSTDTFTPTQNGSYTFTLTTLPSSGSPTNNTASVTVTVSDPPAPVQPSTKSGCSMAQGVTVNPSERFDWWLVFGFVTWLGAVVYRRRQPARR